MTLRLTMHIDPELERPELVGFCACTPTDQPFAPVPTLRLPHPTWLEMGRPDTVTVHIDPAGGEPA